MSLSTVTNRWTSKPRTRKAAGLGLFVRSLLGRDREAAKPAFAEFLTNEKLSANQIEFVNQIDHLTEHSVVDVAALYESPHTDTNS